MDRKLIRKSNFLIEASYKLSAIEQKIILILVSMIQSNDKEFRPYPLKIQNVIQIIGLQTNNDYTYLKEATRNLMGKVFTITTPTSELQTHWFSSAEYFEGRGEVEFTFDPKLKPFLLQLKERFTTYRLKEAIQLKSSFSIRMLELLRQYEKLGERIIEVQKLRELLGIGQDQYKLYADLKKRVILPAQKELTLKTNISFDFEEIKTSHAVEKLRFKIKSTTRKLHPPIEVLIPAPAENPDLQRLIQILPEAYREKDSIKKLLAGHLKKSGFDFVVRNIEYANDGSNAVKPGANMTKGSNYRNYLAKALTGDFGLSHKEDKETKTKAAEDARKKAQEEAIVQKQRLEQAQSEKENHERARIFQQSLPPEALEQLKTEAFSRLDPQHQEMVKRKTTGSEMMLKIMMDKISLEHMKISRELPQKEAESQK